MDKDILKDLVQKYLAGECTSKEINIIYSSYDSLDKEPDGISLLNEEQQQELKNKMLNRIMVNIQTVEGKTESNSSGKTPPFNTLLYFIAGIAAVFLLVLGFVFFNQEKPVSPAVKDAIVVTNRSYTLYKQVLPDGSIVWLSPKSSMRYPRSFDQHSRIISMDGEAFFEITKDHRRPFSIYSGDVITKVWGTSFRISAYPEAKSTEVSVLSGKVSVSLSQKKQAQWNTSGTSGKDGEIILLPHQKATYVKSGKVLIRKQEAVSNPSINIWIKTTISFENTSVNEVMSALNKKFGVHIYSPDAQLGNLSLNADFTDQSLPSILEMMQKSLNITYEINGNTIQLKKQ